MLVVLVVLGLAIAILVERGPARSVGFDLRSSAADVAQMLRRARAQAIATNRITSFGLDSASRSYGVDGTFGTALPPEVALAITTAAGGPPRSQAAIRFAPDGSSSGGRVVLVARGRRRQVVVDWLTGRVRITDAP
jgi:general secretion pathway protein H